MIEFKNNKMSKKKNVDNTDNIYVFTSPEQVVYVRNYITKDSTARNMKIEHIENGELKQYIKAVSAKWNGATKSWQLRNYQIRKIDGMDEDFSVSREVLDTMINLAPEDFLLYRDHEKMLTSKSILEKIERDEERGLSGSRPFKAEFYRRTADPFTIIILTLIGFTLASRKVRGGIGIHITVSLVLGAIYIFLSRFSILFAISSTLPPGLAVFIPNIIFAGIAFLLVRYAQK